MIELIHGRGMLGGELSKRINDTPITCTIYHTWDITDKTEQRQKECYDQFVKYVKENPDKSIVFISSDSTKYSPYMEYKHRAERFILENTKTGKVIRLPLLIGNGVFKLIKTGTLLDLSSKYMRMNTAGNAAEFILKSLWNVTRLEIMPSYEIPSEIAKELILYGKAENA